MTLEQGCEQAILNYAPYYRQINALQGEHAEYVNAVLAIHRKHYQQLRAAGATEWTPIREEHTAWLDENKPY